MIDLVCGCLGRRGAPLSLDRVHSMLESLSFGRPSAASVWADGPIALGRVTLAPDGVIPTKPVLHRRRSFTVAADLRVPDRPEDEAAHDAVFEALENGTFPDALDGDFALAAWDSDRNELMLARDRVGIRPLFFARPDPECFVFASFPDALIDGGAVEGRFRPDRMAVRALGGSRDAGADTWLEGVYRLRPGHVMRLGTEAERIRRYWQYPVGRATSAYRDHASAARALRSRLEGAVARALPDRGPIFTHLSGGLDSSAVTALAARSGGRTPPDITGCSFTVPEEFRALGGLGEEPAARSVAHLAGVTFLPIAMDAVGHTLMSPLGRTFLVSDSPESAHNRLLGLASARGADRMICGYGGDEAVSYNGRGAVLADFLALRWRTVLRTSPELPQPLWRTLANQAAETFLPPQVEERVRRVVGSRSPHQPNPSLYRGLRYRAVSPRFRTRWRWAWPIIGTARLQRERLGMAGFVERLETHAWQAARFGMRYVFPLLDWRLLEFAATLPASLQIRGGMGRGLFRTAVADLLPREILERRAKLSPIPATAYQLSLYRDELIAEARRVAGSAAASAVIDLAEIERRLASLPEPEAVAEAMRTSTAEGAQYRDHRAMSIVKPFFVARALAQNEAECAARRKVHHEAA